MNNLSVILLSLVAIFLASNIPKFLLKFLDMSADTSNKDGFKKYKIAYWILIGLIISVTLNFISFINVALKNIDKVIK